ncbi:MAG: DVU0298 family protein [Thermodesulfovibrionales bacterium]
MMAGLKDNIKAALLKPDFDSIVSMALKEKKVFRILISLAYDKTELICWRAIEAIGKAAGALKKEDPDFVRNIVQRLLWSLSEESGGIGWSAPDMLGEIVINAPDLFPDIPPIILSFKDEESFLPGVLRAMGRIAEAGINGLDRSLCRDIIIRSLNDKSPFVRGTALWAASMLKMMELKDKVSSLLKDDESFLLYEDQGLKEISVKEMAGRFLKIENQE